MHLYIHLYIKWSTCCLSCKNMFHFFFICFSFYFVMLLMCWEKFMFHIPICFNFVRFFKLTESLWIQRKLPLSFRYWNSFFVLWIEQTHSWMSFKNTQPLNLDSVGTKTSDSLFDCVWLHTHHTHTHTRTFHFFRVISISTFFPCSNVRFIFSKRKRKIAKCELI